MVRGISQSANASTIAKRALLASGSVGLSMNKLELPAEFMPVPCPLAGKSPIGFWIRRGAGDGPGQLPAYQLRKLQSRQQFTALRLNCLPCRGRGRARVGRALLLDANIFWVILLAFLVLSQTQVPAEMRAKLLLWQARTVSEETRAHTGTHLVGCLRP